jgi:hypothetical protein
MTNHVVIRFDKLWIADYSLIVITNCHIKLALLIVNSSKITCTKMFPLPLYYEVY